MFWCEEQRELALALVLGCFGRIDFKAVIFQRLELDARAIRLRYRVGDVLEHFFHAFAGLARDFIRAANEALTLLDKFLYVSVCDLSKKHHYRSVAREAEQRAPT